MGVPQCFKQRFLMLILVHLQSIITIATRKVGIATNFQHFVIDIGVITIKTVRITAMFASFIARSVGVSARSVCILLWRMFKSQEYPHKWKAILH